MSGAAPHRSDVRSGGVGPAHGLAFALLTCGCYNGDFFEKTCMADEVCSTSTAIVLIPDTTTEDTTGTTTGSFLDVPAFRVNSLTLIDPHVHAPIPPPCADLTDRVNTMTIPAQLMDGESELVIILDDYDPDVAAQSISLYAASCTNDAVPVCAASGPAAPLAGSLESAGACALVDDATIDPANLGSLNDPQGPCVRTGAADFTLPVSLTQGETPLKSGQLAFQPNPLNSPTSLINGLVWGFVTETDAMGLVQDFSGSQLALWSLIAGGASCSMNDDTEEHDVGGSPTNGVWLYLNFTGEAVLWSA